MPLAQDKAITNGTGRLVGLKCKNIPIKQGDQDIRAGQGTAYMAFVRTHNKFEDLSSNLVGFFFNV